MTVIRWIRLLAALSVLAGSGIACKKSTSTPTPTPGPACSDTNPCTGGLVCDTSTGTAACVACKRDRECARDEFCHPLQRRCALRPCFGRDCGTHDDCSLGTFCVQGLCLGASEERSDGCRVVSCAGDEVCNEGERCHPVNRVCEEDLGCAADSDCGADQRCNVPAARCEAACTPENAVAMCGIKRPCFQGACVDCVVDADCGVGLACNEALHVCEGQSSCTRDADCEIPLVCNRRTRSCTVDPGPCVSAEDCLPEEACLLATGKCVPATCVADRFEPNNIPSEAALVPAGVTPNLTLCTGEADYYRVALGAGDRIRVVVEVDPLLRFQVAVLDGAAQMVGEGELSAEAIAPAAGDYLIRARSADPYVRYGLRVGIARGVPCDADDSEPNDDPLRATVLNSADLYQQMLCPTDADWYVAAVQPGRNLEVELSHVAADGDLELEVVGADRTQLLGRSATTADTEVVRVPEPTGSTVFIRVFGAASGERGRYDLHVRWVAP